MLPSSCSIRLCSASTLKGEFRIIEDHQCSLGVRKELNVAAYRVRNTLMKFLSRGRGLLGFQPVTESP